MRYVMGVDEHGQRLDVHDPAAPDLAAAVQAADRLAPTLLDMRPAFGALGQDPRARTAVTAVLA